MFYSLYDLKYIEETINKNKKNINNHVSILVQCGLSKDEIYRKGYLKNIQSEIKELKQAKKDLLKYKSNLNAKLLGKNVRYYDEDGSSGVNYWVFHKGCTNNDIIRYLESYGIDTEGVHWNSMYDCTGKYFSHEIDIYEKEKTIVASQSWGYDV
jgi:hypothetical protein